MLQVCSKSFEVWNGCRKYHLIGAQASRAILIKLELVRHVLHRGHFRSGSRLKSAALINLK